MRRLARVRRIPPLDNIILKQPQPIKLIANRHPPTPPIMLTTENLEFADPAFGAT
jgi:hypothetical protein